MTEKNCEACRFCFMEPSDPNFTCGHPDAGVFGTYINRAASAAGHCGPERPKFEQHPLRHENGDLKR